jgi:hypothetical protein
VQSKWVYMDAEILQRLERIEAVLEELLRQQVVREFYTTAQAASVLKRAEYTVREWCRHGQVRAEKRRSGRGLSKEWVIPHVELLRIEREGPLPLGTFWEQKGPSNRHAG